MQRVASVLLRQAAAAAAHGRRQPSQQRLRPRRAVPAHRYTTRPITAIASPYQQSPSGLQEAVPGAWSVPRPQQAAPGAAGGAAIQRHGASLWQAYLDSLARRPLLTKAITSFVCCVIGDSIAQALGASPYSVTRVLRLATYSSTVGAATGHFWHRWLDSHVHPDSPTSSQAVLKKTLYDQLLLTPVMTAAFFSALKLMEGRPDAIVPFLQDKYVLTLLTGWAVWGPWNIISFKLIPQDLRLLAGNLLGIAWGTYMSVSCVNSSSSASAVCPAPPVAPAMALQPQDLGPE